MRYTVFCVLCISISGQICRAQELKPPTDFETVAETKLIKMPEPPSGTLERPFSPSPKPMGQRPAPKLFLLTSAGVYSAAVLDMRNTRNAMNLCSSQPSQYMCHENNPLARPFVSLPAPAYYATGLGFATGINWLSWKMARSEKFRRTWFLPQMAAMLANGLGYASSTKVKASY